MAKQSWNEVKRSLATKKFNGVEFSLYRGAETKTESNRQFKEYKMPKGMKYRRIKLKGFHLIYIAGNKK